MCGIAGWVDRERNLLLEREIVEKMVQTLAPRGPDGYGFWVSPQALLAHRRLIVVDPEGGAQPMACRVRGRRFVITYNGEIYNVPELRRELSSRGHRFATRSDTETLLLSFAEWGVESLRMLNGIFAFAVWDEEERRLFLVRDRLGVKPLFYAPLGSGLLFGSELKALLAHPEFPREVDEEGLAEILGLGPGRTPGQGVFRGARELLPGTFLVFDSRGLRTHRYWRLEARPHLDDLEETARKVRELLEDAVKRQLQADVPVCTLLSGGLDSSAVSAFAARETSRLRTFSVAYRENGSPEPNEDLSWAELVSRLLGTSHRTVWVSLSALGEALEEGVRARDLPGMADIDTSLYLLCREVKEEATVALSGESADELFGGYPWFRHPRALEEGVFPWARELGLRLSFFSPELRRKLRLEEYVRERFREVLQETPLLPGEEEEERQKRQMTYLNLTRFLPVLLERKDRMSMAVGLEVRVPFCDHRLVEYAWNIPWEMKTLGGREKGILREALRGVLPEEVRVRRKSPYPKTRRDRYLEKVQGLLLETLETPSSPLRDLLDLERAREFARHPGELPSPWFGQLMGPAQVMAYLVQVDLWLRLYRVRLRI
jgi:asparagine synthase (glutamine-hydrolysing)